MADVTLFQGETRYVKFPVTATTAPLADTVDVAFIAEGAVPGVADWHPAEWVAGQVWISGQPVYAAVQIGPNDLALTPGTYEAVLKIPDGTVEPWIPAGTVRIRAVIAEAMLREIRAEVGAAPADDELADLWAQLQSVPAVALAVLRPRLADALRAAAAGSVSIPGVISVGAPASPQFLRDQVARLEGMLDPTDDGDELAGVGVGRMTRASQRRGLPYR